MIVVMCHLMHMKLNLSKLSFPKKKMSANLPEMQEPKEHAAVEIGQEETRRQKRFSVKFSWPEKKSHQIMLIAGLVFCVFLCFVAALGTYTYSVGRSVAHHGQQLIYHAQNASSSFGQQNLPEVVENLALAQTSLEQAEITYLKLDIFRFFPLINRYYFDGQSALEAAHHGLLAAQTAAEALVPYADVLGFEGEGTFEGGTAEDRIGLLLDTLEMISPQLDEVEKHLAELESKISMISPTRYPEQLRSQPIRSKIFQVQETVSHAIRFFSEFRPVIEELPNIAGAQGNRKKYLILFQNNNELRPTGGFLTAYSIIFIENGKVTPDKSDDIYELDKKFNERIPIPESLGRSLTTERYWNLRDMNISPDFKESMDVFFSNYQKIRGEPQDVAGIIAVDTQVLTRLLEILGPVEVPGYGTFSAMEDARCDCPQVVYALSEIITRPTPYHRDDRKGILGPMMQAILHKTYGAPKQHWPELFGSIWELIQGRHIQMYFLDEAAQLAAQNANAAGRLHPKTEGDFLAIVDANLGGAKSTLFTESDVKLTVDGPIDGYLHNTVEITYRNTRKADNCNLEAGQLCLNAPAPTWHRLYLPAGSKLVEAQGFTQEPELYEELGFQVIDGFYRLDPLSMTKIRVSYQVPYSLDRYQLAIWKQGGIKPFELLLDVNGNQSKTMINQDTILSDEL